MLKTSRALAAFAAVGMLLAMGGSASGASITWAPAQPTNVPGDIRTDGTLVKAVNLRNSNTGSVTVNGVPFANSDALLSQGGAGGMLAGADTGDPNLNTLLNTLDWGDGTSTSTPMGGGGLIAGNTYLVQTFYTDRRSCCNGRTMTFGDGEAVENTVNVHASAGGGYGQFATGTFTADATTQTLTLKTNGFGNSHLTAYQIREIAAPVQPVFYSGFEYAGEPTPAGVGNDAANLNGALGQVGSFSGAIPDGAGGDEAPHLIGFRNNNRDGGRLMYLDRPVADGAFSANLASDITLDGATVSFDLGTRRTQNNSTAKDYDIVGFDTDGNESFHLRALASNNNPNERLAVLHSGGTLVSSLVSTFGGTGTDANEDLTNTGGTPSANELAHIILNLSADGYTIDFARASRAYTTGLIGYNGATGELSRIEFQFQGGGDNAVRSGFYLDNLSAFGTAPTAIIPEPVTMIALFAGVAGLGGYVRKRRRLGRLGVGLLAVCAFLAIQGAAVADLVNHWAFDETSGTTAYDTGTLSKDGDIQVAAGVTINQTGKLGQAYSFDGTDNAEVRITGYKGITGRDVRTTSVWLKTPTAQSGRGLYSWGTDSKNNAWDVVLNNHSKLRLNLNNGNRRGATNLNDDAWHLATITWSNDGSPNVNDAKIYVDGAVDTPYTTDGTGLNTGSALDVHIGVGRKRGNSNNQEFIGLLDDVAFWTEELTAGEVMGLYNVGDTLGYDAGEFDKLKQAHEAGAGSSVVVGGKTWSYTTYLAGADGQLTNVGGGDYELVLDAFLGTGLQTAPLPAPPTAPVVLLDDHFANGNLPTGEVGSVNAGFQLVTNSAGGAGTASEAGTDASVSTTGGNYDNSGIVSLNTVDVTPHPDLGFTATWEVTSAQNPKANGINLSLQSDDGFINTGAGRPNLLFRFDETDNNNFRLLAHDGVAANAVNLFTTGITLGEALDGFTLTATLNTAGWSFTTTGLPSLGSTSGAWTATHNYLTLFDSTMHAGAFIQKGTGGNKTLVVDRITITQLPGATVIPEPATMIALVAGVAGLGRYVRRRQAASSGDFAVPRGAGRRA